MAMKKTTSMVLYKLRSGTTFEPLLLPGSHLSARLLDVKRAVARAEGIDFPLSSDLVVRNATTDEVYDDSATLFWGTRVVVRIVEASEGRPAESRAALTRLSGMAPMGNCPDEATELTHMNSKTCCHETWSRHMSRNSSEAHQ